MFRIPTTSGDESSAFYQSQYRQGITTSMPSDAQLAQYLRDGFKEKDFTDRIQVVMAAVGADQRRLFDFGCSWGYGSYQFIQAGFEVEGFEVSRPRAAFARERLGVTTHSTLETVEGPFDVFFSSHVLEHVPSVTEAISFARRVLAPGGLFIAFTPNGSSCFRKRDILRWRQLWGSVHPNFLDEEFYRHEFRGAPLYMTSGGTYDPQEIACWRDQARTVERDMSNAELLLIARP
jgi:2-polyprenyl-3-methyl-5-hydroxy-6-metoxy-1,4-benzoquinol methylase